MTDLEGGSPIGWSWILMTQETWIVVHYDHQWSSNEMDGKKHDQINVFWKTVSDPAMDIFIALDNQEKNFWRFYHLFCIFYSECII